MRVDGFPFEPVLDRIFVCDYGQPDRSVGGIIFGDDEEQFYRYRNSEWRFGQVIAIGPGGFNRVGRRMPMPNIKLSEQVMFSRKHGSRLPGDIRYKHKRYGDLLIRVLDPEKCIAVVGDWEPWWNVQFGQLDPSGTMTG